MVNNQSQDKECLLDLVVSPGWRLVCQWAREHQEYLQTQVNLKVRQCKDREAGQELAKLDDCTYIVDKVKSVVNELKMDKEQNKKGDNDGDLKQEAG